MKRAFAWLTCRLTGHRRIHRINSVKLVDASLDDIRFRVLDSDYYCARCGKDPLP